MLIVSRRVGKLIRIIEKEHQDWAEIEVILEAYRRDAPEFRKEVDLFWGKDEEKLKEIEAL